MSLVLTQLNPGEIAVVTGFQKNCDLRRRLQDIGLIEGTKVECVGKSPMGDPSAFMIRKAVIALRSEESGMVNIQRVDLKEKCH